MSHPPSLLRSALVFPVRPAPIVRSLREGGGAMSFTACTAIVVSIWAGLRAWLLVGEPGHGFLRFGTSLFGFVLVPALVLLAGRMLGGRANWLLLAAVVAGCAVPFLLIDSAWIGALAVLGADWAASEEAVYLVHAERLIQGWAGVVLLFGLAEAQLFSRWRAVANVAVILLAVVAVIAAVRTMVG